MFFLGNLNSGWAMVPQTKAQADDAHGHHLELCWGCAGQAGRRVPAPRLALPRAEPRCSSQRAARKRRWFPDQHLMGWVFWFGLFYLFIFLLSPIIIIHIDYTYRWVNPSWGSALCWHHECGCWVAVTTAVVTTLLFFFSPKAHFLYKNFDNVWKGAGKGFSQFLLCFLTLCCIAPIGACPVKALFCGGNAV